VKRGQLKSEKKGQFRLMEKLALGGPKGGLRKKKFRGKGYAGERKHPRVVWRCFLTNQIAKAARRAKRGTKKKNDLMDVEDIGGRLGKSKFVIRGRKMDETWGKLKRTSARN